MKSDMPLNSISEPYTATARPAPGFRERLRQARELRGLTAAQLDDLAGSPKGSCSRFERDETREISALRFTRYARALGVRVQWLWTGELPIDAPPPPDILGITPDAMEMRHIAAKIARRDGVSERVIYLVVTNPAYNTRDMHWRPLHYWVGVFSREAIDPPNLASAVAAFRWDDRLSSDDKAQIIAGARRRAAEMGEDTKILSIGRWRDLLRIGHLDLPAYKIRLASITDETSILSAPPSRDACKKNAVLVSSNLDVTFAALYPPWGGHTQECLVTIDAVSRHAEGRPGCVTVRNWPCDESRRHTLPTENHLCSAEKIVEFGLAVLEKQVALQRTREGGPVTIESNWIDGAIARLEALRTPK